MWLGLTAVDTCLCAFEGDSYFGRVKGVVDIEEKIQPVSLFNEVFCAFGNNGDYQDIREVLFDCIQN